MPHKCIFKKCKSKYNVQDKIHHARLINEEMILIYGCLSIRIKRAYIMIRSITGKVRFFYEQISVLLLTK